MWGDWSSMLQNLPGGNEGLETVRKVAQALVGAGARVDRRCGFHVHVNARDLTGADVLNCIRRYATHESQIDGFMPVSRRGVNNTYCRAMEDVVRAVRNVSESATAMQVAQRIYERYYKLNVQAFTRHGTIEFRQHSGTVDYRKMINWIIFCVQFVEDSRAIAVPIPQTATTGPVVGSTLRRNAVEHKMMLLAQLLDQHTDRYDSVPGSMIASHLGVEESTVPSYISQFRQRYPLVQIQARRGHGYYRDGNTSLVSLVNGTARNVPAVRLETPPERGVFASLSPDVASYFHERTMDLAMSN
jgi:biotin operon repressor